MAKNPVITKLDYEQVIQRSYNEADDRLRVDAAITLDDVTLDIQLDAADDSVAIGDGTNLVTTTVDGSKTGLDVNVLNGITGDVTQSGLKTGLKTQAVTITDVASKVPLVPLAGRNSMSVRVFSNVTVYFGDEDVTDANGYPKFFREEIILDIKDNNAVALWAVCAPGESAELRIIELA